MDIFREAKTAECALPSPNTNTIKFGGKRHRKTRRVARKHRTRKARRVGRKPTRGGYRRRR